METASLLGQGLLQMVKFGPFLNARSGCCHLLLHRAVGLSLLRSADGSPCTGSPSTPSPPSLEGLCQQALRPALPSSKPTMLLVSEPPVYQSASRTVLAG